jgi:hypothetical protein
VVLILVHGKYHNELISLINTHRFTTSFGQPMNTLLHPAHGQLILPGQSTMTNVSASDYPRSVANMVGHGTAASDRSTKKAQLDETQQW